MKFSALAENLGLTEDEFLELVDLFLDTSASDLRRLQSAIDEGDIQKVFEVTHSMKEACGNMGFMKAHEVAKRIEEEAREMSAEQIGEAVQAFKEELGVVKKLARG